MNALLATTDDFHQFTFNRLDRLRDDWEDADHPPSGVSGLSTGERCALVLACGHESLLNSPLRAFLNLDDWLQRWVLQRRRLTHFIGVTVG